MRYSITPDKRVLKNGVEVGHIEGGTCYMIDPPKGRGISSFREMAGMKALKFVETLTAKGDSAFEQEMNNTTVAGLKTQPVYQWATPGDEPAPALPEPPNNPHLGDKDPVWQRWFIATYGEDAFKSRWPHRQLPQ